MTALDFARWLAPLAVIVLVGGWVLAVVAYLAIGTETCTTVAVPLAGNIQACTDTTTTSVVLVVVIGFAATVGSLFLFALRFLLISLADIEANTRSPRE
ncbi:MAG TPA: hypothetical protein VLS25_06485 [Dehalococcoidia bacterium]|nr:hypothetical protein [Dehalococcoidia bacterium]